MKARTPTTKHAELFQQALALYQSGQYADANSKYRRLLQDFPQHPQVLAGLGFVAVQQDNYQQAIHFLTKSVSISPQQANVWVMLGRAYTKLNDLQAALASYDKALALQADYVVALNNRANVLYSLERFQEAISGYQQAIALKADYAEAHFNLANALKHLQRYEEAVTHFATAINLRNDYVAAYLNCGNTLLSMQQAEQALACFQQLLQLQAEHVDALLGCANACVELRKLADALFYYDQALEYSPDQVKALNNRGNVLRQMQRYDAALLDFKRALALAPDDIEVHNNYGLLLLAMHRLDDALAQFNQGMQCPQGKEDPYLQLNKALLLLSLGEFTEGWRLYEARWRSIQKNVAPNFSQSLWLGDVDLTDKVLLVSFEQGFGDFIQFCRYAILLTDIAGSVLLETPPSLMGLAQTLPHKLILVEKGQNLPHFDYYCPLMSLPLAFKTDLQTIPAQTPYLFADPARQKQWRAKLGVKHSLRIGLVCSGSSIHTNDVNRSIPLAAFAPLLQCQAEFYLVQKELRADDQVTLKAFASIQHFELNDFADTAALLAELDLLISVDTSVAHLAGALAMPTWLLLPLVADFRWLLQREDSPWYPNMRLFRQTTTRDWSEVLAQVAIELQALLIESGYAG